MVVYRALPQPFAQVHRRYQTPWFGTLVVGVGGCTIYLVMALVSQNSLADMVASLALATAFYYAITAYACVWTYRRTLLGSARDFWLRGALPFVLSVVAGRFGPRAPGARAGAGVAGVLVWPGCWQAITSCSLR